MIQVFPISIVPNPEPVYVTRGGQRKRCSVDRLWYADWHDARRGPGAAPHRAQDMFAPLGSLVLAPENGVVLKSTRDSAPTPKGGNNLYLRASSGRVYYFAHLAEPPEVGRGAFVEAGQLLGRVGRTGNARTTCPHLHIAAFLPGPPRVNVNLFEELKRLDPTKGGRLRRTPAPPEQTK